MTKRRKTYHVPRYKCRNFKAIDGSAPPLGYSGWGEFFDEECKAIYATYKCTIFQYREDFYFLFGEGVAKVTGDKECDRLIHRMDNEGVYLVVEEFKRQAAERQGKKFEKKSRIIHSSRLYAAAAMRDNSLLVMHKFKKKTARLLFPLSLKYLEKIRYALDIHYADRVCDELMQ